MVRNTLDNRFGITKFIVDPTAADGAYTTIQAAITAASSGDTIFIKDGSYTENLTLKNGVELTTFTRTANVTVTGQLIVSSNNMTCRISNIRFTSNAATIIDCSGATNTLVFTFCSFTGSNGDILTNTTSGINFVYFFNCRLSCANTYKVINQTGNALTAEFYDSSVIGDTASTLANFSNCSFFNCSIRNPVSLTGSSEVYYYDCQVYTSNLTFITLATGTVGYCANCSIQTDNASIMSITSTGAGYAYNCVLNSANANTVTGTGSFNDAGNVYRNTRNPNTTTVNLTNNTYCNGTGTAGQLLVSNGANKLPTWQDGTRFTQVKVQAFAGNGTYTPTTGMKYCTVEVVGGGGGGGGAGSTTATQVSVGGGGGGAGYARETYAAATIGASQTVTIGSAGTAGANTGGNGGNGGDTTFGALLTGAGGIGGNGSAGTATTTSQNGGAAGSGSGGDVNVYGTPGGIGFGTTNAALARTYTGQGGGSTFGGGGAATVQTTGAAGSAGNNYGGGGGGGGNYISQASGRLGGAGAPGFCIVTEYI